MTHSENQLIDNTPRAPKDKLLSRMHKTKGARFTAHKRLSKKHYVNGYTVAILSFYVICITAGLLVFEGNYTELTGQFMTFLSVALSVLIIIISLLEASEKYDVKAEAMHNCAREINEIYLPLKYKENDDISEELNNYRSIINKYPFNHDDIDRDMHTGIENDDLKYGVKIRYVLSIFGMNVAYLLLPPLIVVIWFMSAQSHNIEGSPPLKDSVQTGSNI